MTLCAWCQRVASVQYIHPCLRRHTVRPRSTRFSCADLTLRHTGLLQRAWFVRPHMCPDLIHSEFPGPFSRGWLYKKPSLFLHKREVWDFWNRGNKTKLETPRLVAWACRDHKRDSSAHSSAGCQDRAPLPGPVGMPHLARHSGARGSSIVGMQPQRSPAITSLSGVDAHCDPQSSAHSASTPPSIWPPRF